MKAVVDIFRKNIEWLIILFLVVNLSQIDYKFTNFIKSDGKAYYGYLPAVFIYDDLQYNFIDSYENRYYSTGYVDFRREIDGRYANIAFVGLAVLWIPFFLLAHIVSLLAGFPADGYSLLYQLSVVFAAFFYLLIGLIYLRKFLRLYQIKHWIISTVHIFMVFGTPIYMYALHEAAFTHVYTFSLIIIFFYYTRLYFLHLKAKHFYAAITLLSFIVLIRPTNMMTIAAVPFLAGNLKMLTEGILSTFKHYRRIILGLLIVLAVLSIQFTLWYLQTGKIFAYTYTDEGLTWNFFDPQIINILFSYKKGFFLYTPLAFISLIGFMPLFRRNKFAAWSLLGFIVLFVYILSTWSHWWFGRSFGNRGLLDFMAVFAILLAFALSIKSTALRASIITLSLLFVVVNQIQAYQYRQYILYWDMDKESYWQVFLKTDEKYEGLLWKDRKKFDKEYTVEELTNQFSGPGSNLVSVDFEQPSDVAQNKIPCLTDEKAYEGNYSFMLNQKCPYSPGFHIFVDSLTEGSNINVTTEFYFYSEENLDDNPFSVVFTIQNKEDLLNYITLESEKIEAAAGKWHKIAFSRTITEKFPDKENILKGYIWYRGKTQLYIDGLQMIYYP